LLGLSPGIHPLSDVNFSGPAAKYIEALRWFASIGKNNLGFKTKVPSLYGKLKETKLSVEQAALSVEHFENTDHSALSMLRKNKQTNIEHLTFLLKETDKGDNGTLGLFMSQLFTPLYNNCLADVRKAIKGSACKAVVSVRGESSGHLYYYDDSAEPVLKKEGKRVARGEIKLSKGKSEGGMSSPWFYLSDRTKAIETRDGSALFTRLPCSFGLKHIAYLADTADILKDNLLLDLLFISHEDDMQFIDDNGEDILGALTVHGKDFYSSLPASRYVDKFKLSPLRYTVRTILSGVKSGRSKDIDFGGLSNTAFMCYQERLFFKAISDFVQGTRWDGSEESNIRIDVLAPLLSLEHP
jgi:hypothetical protein